MARDSRGGVKAKDLQGFGYLNQLQPLLQRLHDSGRDKSGNRELFFDQYVSLLLLYFFNPILTSLNGLQQATRLAKVQELIGGGRFLSVRSAPPSTHLTLPCSKASSANWSS